MTTDGGQRWFHLNGLQEVWVKDVAYAANGRTVIATVDRNLRIPNGGGIWRSPDEGSTWTKTGDVPAPMGSSTRTGAFGISFAPDEPNKVYVATDYGIAVSTHDGTTWSHQMLGASCPRDTASAWGARSVQALPGGRALAVNAVGVYLNDAGSNAWCSIRSGSFIVIGDGGFKHIDVSPYDFNKVFILQNYSILLLYDVTTNRWTRLRLPNCCSDQRGPFVRASQSPAGPPGIDLWVGLGTNLFKTSCQDYESCRRLQATDWQRLERPQGLHNDCGYLGLDDQKRS